MKNALHAAAAVLLISMSAGSAMAQVNSNAGPQDQAPVVRTIEIVRSFDTDGGKVIISKSANKGFNLIDASTFGDAKVEKLIEAIASGAPITIVTRGNVIVDVR